MPKEELIYLLNDLKSFLEFCGGWESIRQQYALDEAIACCSKYYGKPDKQQKTK
jgi:hypothetical protein